MSSLFRLPLTVSLVALITSVGCSADLTAGGDSPGSVTPNPTQSDPNNPSTPDNPSDPNDPPPGDDGLPSISRDDVAASCEELGGALSVGVTKLRRLSVLEFNNTVQSLLGGPFVDYAPDLPDDEPMGPFVSNQSLVVGTQEARQYLTVAEVVADTALATGSGFLPCAAPSGLETECIQQFIEQLAPRAFRRPLEEGEAQSLLDIYELGRDGSAGQNLDVNRGLHLLLRAIIGSPDLLYIVDTGLSGAPTRVPETASAFTLASRLSLAFWNAPPDDELLALAENGQLLDETVYSAQVERMLADARAEGAVAQFFAQLTGVDELLEKEKDPQLFPQYGEQLAREMLSEQAEFVTDIIFRQDGLFSTLLQANYASPGPELAALYGVAATAPVTLPVDQRRGLFTQAGYLAAHNKPDATSPVHLGINVREAILCEVMPPPPPGINTTLPEVTTEIRTSRDRFALHETGPCKGCHELIDPIGLAFEHYDAIGAYRETDNGAPIDPTGQIIESETRVGGPFFTGALELSEQLAQSTQARDCISRQMLRSALDRQESSLDACTVLALVEGFEASGGNLRLLLSQIAHTEAFKQIVLEPPGETLQ